MNSKYLLSTFEAYSLLIGFGIVMLLLVMRKAKREGVETADSFLVANRQVSLWSGAFSIAVSWIWAPAIFICSMQAYQLGLPGIFWFTLPNILCFFIFAPCAVKLRKKLPKGYTIAQFIRLRFPDDPRTHLALMLVFISYQLGAIIINCLAGGALLHTLSGLDLKLAIILMSIIPLAYSLVSGLKASVYTDVLQMSLILFLAIIIVPWCILKAGGWESVTSGLAGIDGLHGNILDPWVAFAMGIPMTIGLIAGPFSDQMFFQRVWAVGEKNVAKTFIFGGLLFGIVPIILSLLGFIGVSLSLNGAILVSDPQMVGPLVIGNLLPKFALYLFCIMAIAGLCSTMDSAFCAISSLGVVDIYQRYFAPSAKDQELLKASRIWMLGLAFVGTSIALLEPKLLWVFLSYGAVAAAGLFPVIFAIFNERIKSTAVFWAVVLSLLVATPLSIYANIQEDTKLIVYSSLFSVSIGLIVILISLKFNSNQRFNPINIK